jgi:hypothetical protein
MTNTNPQHDVPLPTGAVEAGDFNDHPVPSRIICGPYRKVGRASVLAMAVQTVDGAVRAPIVRVESNPNEALSMGQARQFGAEILNAAEEADAWCLTERERGEQEYG